MKTQKENEVLKKLHQIEKLLGEKKSDLFNFVQTAQYLSISHSHLYKLTSQRKIPFHKPSGKYLYFFKDELDLWITNNEEDKQKSSPESGIPSGGEKEEEEPP
ncbi:MAG: helix-turn-helix domain-containing protein [Coriobacteriia bacterium]